MAPFLLSWSQGRSPAVAPRRIVSPALVSAPGRASASALSTHRQQERHMIRQVAIGILALASGVAAAHAQSGASVERGRYLVDTVMTCHNCHTPRGPTGMMLDKALSGGMRFDEPPFDVTASNITSDKESGIGAWSDADIKKLLTTGMRPNGVPVAVIMPTAF